MTANNTPADVISYYRNTIFRTESGVLIPLRYTTQCDKETKKMHTPTTVWARDAQWSFDGRQPISAPPQTIF